MKLAIEFHEFARDWPDHVAVEAEGDLEYKDVKFMISCQRKKWKIKNIYQYH